MRSLAAAMESSALNWAALPIDLACLSASLHHIMTKYGTQLIEQASMFIQLIQVQIGKVLSCLIRFLASSMSCCHLGTDEASDW